MASGKIARPLTSIVYQFANWFDRHFCKPFKGSERVMSMIGIKGIKMPKNCVECNNMSLRDYLGCELIFSGCANCGRHPNCPLVEIVTCKDCKSECTEKNGEKFSETRPDFFCADGERRE